MTITPALLRLLARPPSFIPTPYSCKHNVVFAHVVDFLRRLHWRFFFNGNSQGPYSFRFGVAKSRAWPPPSRVPVSIRRLTGRLLGAARSVLLTPHHCFPGTNLEEDEAEALIYLRSEPGLAIRPADKGGRWVVMDAHAYSSECLRLLRDSNFYRPLPAPLPHQSVDPSSVLSDLHYSNFITRSELRFLAPPPSPRPRHFGILPKIHKSSWPCSSMPPGRPIVADVSSINSNAARLVDHFLQPLVQSQASFLRDSHHLLAVLHSCSLSVNSLLASFDVRSLYTNVPIEEGLRRVQRAFLQQPNPDRPDRQLLDLLSTSLSSNDFVFEDQSWLQVKGVAMGKAFGAAFANIYLGEWETLALNRASHQPTLWKRYQDDILVIWDHGEEALESFLHHLNAQDPNIQVDLHFHADHLRFLDLEIYRGDNNCVGFRIGFKDTDSHRLLPSDSLHAQHVHRGVVYSQILRWATRSYSYQDFINTCHSVFSS